MPGAERAEVYFIVGMMILIVVICVVAVYFFFKTYRKEMREKETRKEGKRETQDPHAETESSNAAS